MSWCFAIVNNRLAEIYFETKKGKPRIVGHCYANRRDYKTRQEIRWIEKDTKKYRIVYRKGAYKIMNSKFSKATR